MKRLLLKLENKDILIEDDRKIIIIEPKAATSIIYSN